jgi:hypothetical protein
VTTYEVLSLFVTGLLASAALATAIASWWSSANAATSLRVQQAAMEKQQMMTSLSAIAVEAARSAVAEMAKKK